MLAALMLAVLLPGCGSRPVRQPAVVVNSNADMALGMRAYQDDNYSEARNYFSRALAQYRSVDERSGELYALIDLADSALGQGDFAAARSYLAATDAITNAQQHADLKARVGLLQAYADLQAGDDQKAVAQLDALLNTPNLPANISKAALFARTQGAFDLKAADANEWMGKLGTALANNPDTLSKARYQRLQALAAQTGGDDHQATQLYAAALDAYRGIYYRPGIAATLEEWAGLNMRQKDWTGARGHLQRALDVRLSMYDRTHSIRDLDNLALVDSALGAQSAAKQAAQLAEYLRNGGNPGQLPALNNQPGN
ncbi:MAG: hypothetical protein KGK44_02090 [Gammaproteobacteria bacterium]|nr:hypothetical protein [Gammaproteobacteria bacterium]